MFVTAAGKLDADNQASIDALKARLAGGNAKVLLYLHGGLVDRAAGLDCAQRLSGRVAPCLDLDDDWLQVYIVWQTGAREEFERNWVDLATKDRLYLAIVPKLIVFLSARLFVGAGPGRTAAASVPISEEEILERLRGEAGDRRAPFAALEEALATPEAGTARAAAGGRKSPDRLAEEYNLLLRNDRLFKEAVEDLGAAVTRDEAGRAAGTPGTALEGEAMFRHLSGEAKSSLVTQLDATAGVAGGRARGPATIASFILGHTFNIARNCIERFRHKRDHGLHATIVEEVCRELYLGTVGATFWEWMVRDAGLHFAEDGFGHELLAAFAAKTPERLVVIGHSAGSIWASRLLLAMSQANIEQKLDLALLAPAVRADLFATMLQTASSLIQRCEMFTMDDGLERADAVLGHDKGYIYPSSLLYVVSGLFERENDAPYRDAPLLGMQRFVSGDWLSPAEQGHAKTIGDFFGKPGNAIHYSKGSGLTASDSHGGFDDDVLTLQSLKARFFA